MWLSRREKPDRAAAAAITGPVTLPGDRLGVYLEGERRNVTVYAPGGYHWAPGVGDRVLVLKAGENGEEPCAVGVPAAGEDLSPGEILIRTGQCSLKLDPEGNVALTGVFTVNGTVVGPLPKEKEDPPAGTEEDPPAETQGVSTTEAEEKNEWR